MGDPLPPLWHWLYFLEAAPMSKIAPDGHGERGEFLPPIPLPRRMWAGSRFTFQGEPLRIGDTARRVSEIKSIEPKTGSTGSMVFVTVRHTLAGAKGTALLEEHDIVYREAAKPGEMAREPKPAPTDSTAATTIVPDPVLLFRFSALTFNGHRIHYDRRYATQVEGYPGLVVHGPLIATLLLDLLRDNLPQSNITRFTFRAVNPLFDTAPFWICGNPEDNGKTIRLWAKDAEGALAMEATALC
jgi:3-methylfumaryl-CoA hydratase